MFKLLYHNLFRTMCTKFYQNRLGFVEDMNILVCFFGSQCSYPGFPLNFKNEIPGLSLTVFDIIP